MKSNAKQDYYIITSPEDELKEISLSIAAEKASYQTQRPTKRSTEGFAIDSWDISQKLQPYQNQTSRYRQKISANISPKLGRSRYRVKSAFLAKDLQNSNNHNFQSRKKVSIEISTQRKTSFFVSRPLSTIEKAKISLSRSKQSIKEKEKLKKSRNTIERKLRQQQQTRTKTIESYLIHQKQIINREKQIIISQRMGKEEIVFCMYPTQYWQSISPMSMKKSRKLKLNKTPLRNSQPKERTSTINSNSPIKKMNYSLRKDDRDQTRQSQSQSPIKRYRQFKQKLHQIAIH